MQKNYRKSIRWLFLFLGLLVFHTQPLRAQEKTVSINAKGRSIKDALQQIESQSGYTITYSSSLLAGKKSLTEDLPKMSVSTALTQVLKGTGLGYRIDKENIIIYRLPAEKRSPGS